MSGGPNILSQFWQELKRRKVTRVITVYAAAAFVILQLVEILAPSLRLPEWTMNFILVLLIVGFVIAVILSWIYDVHPEEGIVKTEPASDILREPAPPSSKGWKIATYVSILIIIGLLLFNMAGRGNKVSIEQSLEKSIAVLPFLNLSGDSDQDNRCLALTDEVITHLYKIESFDKVPSFTSVRAFHTPDKLIPQIADELKVNYIVQSTYKEIGGQMRVSVQLIEAKNEKLIWLQDYDRSYKDIVSLPAEIALQIADKLEANLTNSEKQNVQKIPTYNQKAYELIQQCRIQLQKNNYSFAFLDSALKAIELDPHYAEAYYWAGTSIYLQGSFFGTKDIQSATWEALPFILKARDLDQGLSLVHIGMATLYLWTAWDYSNAELEYLNAMELEPNNPVIESQYLEFLNKMDRPEEVFSLKNLSAQTFTDLSKTYLLLGDRSGAENTLKTYIDSIGITSLFGGLPFVGECYLWMNEYNTARRCLEDALQSEPQAMQLPRFQACLALAFHKTDDLEKAQEIISQLIDKSITTAVGSPAFYTGWYYSWTGELDSAFYWLEKAVQNRSPEIPWLKADPAFNNLKDDPRYWDLYERTGHKAYEDYMASKSQ
jgi:TolB-like protein/Tfp pilus assembly protein PilF